LQSRERHWWPEARHAPLELQTSLSTAKGLRRVLARFRNRRMPFNSEDLVDVIYESLPLEASPGVCVSISPPEGLSPERDRFSKEPSGRRFFSEYEIKKLLTLEERRLRIPKGSILSPLAQEWLQEKDINIAYE